MIPDEWWTSVSFGLILVAFVAARKLTLMLVAAIVALYTGYTGWVYFLMLYNVDIAFGLIGDLIALEESGVVLAQGSKAIIDSDYYRRGELISNLLLPATFVACVGYLVYAYLTAERGHTGPNDERSRDRLSVD